jgi:hypothetical protein
MAATTTTTQATINSTTFTLLGLAPVQVENLGPGNITVVVSDTLPSVGTPGFIQNASLNVTEYRAADTLSNVYAAMFGGIPTLIAYNTVTT